MTTLCLKFNPANYTVWHYRRRCLASICHEKTNTISGESDDDDNYYDPEMVKEELKFTERLGGSNPKNYQIWYHRHALLEPQFSSKKSNHDDEQTLLSLAQHELDYIANVLSHDPKNYHVSLFFGMHHFIQENHSNQFDLIQSNGIIIFFNLSSKLSWYHLSY